MQKKAVFSLKDLKDRLEEDEMDLSLSELREDDLPVTNMAKLPKIRSVDLSNNLLSTLPASFCDLVLIVKLDLQKNLITKLPDEFGKLTKLKTLDLYHNRLKTLPESFGELKSLTWLDLKDNPNLSEGLKTAAGDCLDDNQCRICAARVVKLMGFVHADREKKREEARLQQEEEQRVEEERQRELKKQQKAEEKARRRQQYLEAQKEKNKENGSGEQVSHDDEEKEEKPKHKGETGVVHEKAVEQKGFGVGDLFWMLFRILMTMLVVFSLALTLHLYCKIYQNENEVCGYPIVMETRKYINIYLGDVATYIEKNVLDKLSPIVSKQPPA